MTPALGTHHAQRNSLSQVQTGEQALKSHTLAHAQHPQPSPGSCLSGTRVRQPYLAGLGSRACGWWGCDHPLAEVAPGRPLVHGAGKVTLHGAAAI